MPSTSLPAVFTPEDLKGLGQWLAEDRSGLSSRTMLAIALGADDGDFDAPSDSGDFSRCSELVRAVPAVRQAFPRIAELVPAFRRILERWDELASALDRQELEPGRILELRRVELKSVRHA